MAVIRGLVRIDNEERKASDEPGARLRQRAIYRIWPDFPINALINRSLSTVKADAARTSFSATGQDIVWAVLDSGIDEHHPHFAVHGTLNLDSALTHQDFTVFSGKGDAAEGRVRPRHPCRRHHRGRDTARDRPATSWRSRATATRRARSRSIS